MDYVTVYRKTFGLLLEAESHADAEHRFGALVGDQVLVHGHRVFFTDAHGVEGKVIDPASYEGEGLPRYPGRATMVVYADSLKEAEGIFASIDGTSTVSDTDRELVLELSDSPAETDTMPAAPFFVPIRSIQISRWARAFILRHGGCAYVWTKPFGGDLATLLASTAQPDSVDFELDTDFDDEEVSVFFEEGFGGSPIALRLKRFPRPTLVATGPWTGGAAS